jgi:hypothetical protein
MGTKPKALPKSQIVKASRPKRSPLRGTIAPTSKRMKVIAKEATRQDGALQHPNGGQKGSGREEKEEQPLVKCQRVL